MWDLVGNHIVGFLTRRLICFSGNVYHEYNIIDYSDGLSSATNLSSVTSGHASLVYQRQFRDVPDLSCLHRTGRVTLNPKSAISKCMN